MTRTELPPYAAPARASAPAGPGRPPQSYVAPSGGGDLAILVIVNVTVVFGMWLGHGGWTEISAGRAGFFLGVAQLTGLYASLLALAGITIAARPAALERRVGLDRALGWHRRLGGTFTIVAVVHAVASVIAYADVDQIGVVRELGSLLTHYRFMVPATIGTGMLVVIAVSSMRAMRRRLSYETWYFIHLNAYFAVALAFGHQLTAGSDLVSDHLARLYWIALHVAVLGVIAWSRVGGLVRSIGRQQLRVKAVVPESPDTAALYLGGRQLANIRAEAGQFFLLRVLKPGLWWQTHPYSLSAAPSDRSLRFTVKQLGDASEVMTSLAVGTRVALEGPYGRFTASSRTPGRKVVLVGAGIGIAPLVAILETLGADAAPVVLFRARTKDDLVHLSEMQALVAGRNGAVRTLVGSRMQLAINDPFSAEHLRQALPDIAEREAFVCGPESMLQSARKGLTGAGIPTDRIHCERFWY
jgi:predicted ferric reductase